MATPSKQENKPVFVLHTYPFKETSLVVELFTSDFGRVAVVAKGARRPRSAMRGMLQSFQPLLATWSGKAELKTLHSLEWASGLLMLQGEALMCGFYLNELLLRLLQREDPHENLFHYYALTLKTLSHNHDYATTLRRFELKMLQELGYAVPLNATEHGEILNPEAWYAYVPERGACEQLYEDEQVTSVAVAGKTLLDMAQDQYDDIQTQQQAKQLMRLLIAHYLGDKPLYTRQLLIDLHGM